MKIVFFGTNRLAQIVLEELIKSNYKPQLIITAPDKKAGRGQRRQMSPVKQTALKNNLEILQPESLSNEIFKFQVSSFKFDIAILVAYGQIIPKEILIAPKYGFINVHPSLLPKYRGPSPIQTAILSDDKKIGISIIILDELIDHGPILIQKKITISPKDTHLSLIEYLGKIGARLLIQILPEYLAGSLKPKTQNHSQATFSKRIKKSNGYVDLNNPPDSKTFDRMIRAFYPWPGVYTKLKIKNEKLKIIKFLPGNLIQPEGKRPMTTKEFLNGYPETKKFIGELLNGDNST